jgi:rhomboid-like protein
MMWSSRVKMIPLLIAMNLFVYLLWLFADVPRQPFMISHFLVSWSGVTEGRIWTLLTAVFSHNMFFHFFINMFVLNSFGPIVEKSLGSQKFLRFYLLAGVLSSLSHCLVSAWLLRQPGLPALGASGAISGVILVFALLHPKAKILLLGIIPLPAIIGALAFIGLDLWGLTAQAHGGGLPIGHGAHLGGALAGIIYYLFFSQSVRHSLPTR